MKGLEETDEVFWFVKGPLEILPGQMVSGHEVTVIGDGWMALGQSLAALFIELENGQHVLKVGKFGVVTQGEEISSGPKPVVERMLGADDDEVVAYQIELNVWENFSG